MADKPKIFWRFEHHDFGQLNITGSLGGISLTLYLQQQKFDFDNPTPISADEIIETMRRLEAVLVETVALNDRRKTDGPR